MECADCAVGEMTTSWMSLGVLEVELKRESLELSELLLELELYNWGYRESKGSGVGLPFVS